MGRCQGVDEENRWGGAEGKRVPLPLAAEAWEGWQEEPAASDGEDVHLIQSQGQVVLALGHPAVHIMQHLQHEHAVLTIFHHMLMVSTTQNLMLAQVKHPCCCTSSRQGGHQLVGGRGERAHVYRCREATLPGGLMPHSRGEGGGGRGAGRGGGRRRAVKDERGVGPGPGGGRHLSARKGNGAKDRCRTVGRRGGGQEGCQ